MAIASHRPSAILSGGESQAWKADRTSAGVARPRVEMAEQQKAQRADTSQGDNKEQLQEFHWPSNPLDLHDRHPRHQPFRPTT
jgi:hypothetical protein